MQDWENFFKKLNTLSVSRLDAGHKQLDDDVQDEQSLREPCEGLDKLVWPLSGCNCSVVVELSG